MLEVNGNLVLAFILYFVTAYMRKYPNIAQGTTQNTQHIT